MQARVVSIHIHLHLSALPNAQTYISSITPFVKFVKKKNGPCYRPFLHSHELLRSRINWISLSINQSNALAAITSPIHPVANPSKINTNKISINYPPFRYGSRPFHKKACLFREKRSEHCAHPLYSFEADLRSCLLSRYSPNIHPSKNNTATCVIFSTFLS